MEMTVGGALDLLTAGAGGLSVVDTPIYSGIGKSLTRIAKELSAWNYGRSTATAAEVKTAAHVERIVEFLKQRKKEFEKDLPRRNTEPEVEACEALVQITNALNELVKAIGEQSMKIAKDENAKEPFDADSISTLSTGFGVLAGIALLSVDVLNYDKVRKGRLDDGTIWLRAFNRVIREFKDLPVHLRPEEKPEPVNLRKSKRRRRSVKSLIRDGENANQIPF